MTSNENEETLVFLDFTEKLPSNLLKSRVFVRVTNLDTSNPLVQVNDLIFKGTFQHCLGTNLFFKQTENDDCSDFPFKEYSSTKLEFSNLQTKVISCSQMKIAPKNIPLPVSNENMKFNLDRDYKNLLKKFEDGTLDFQDLFKVDNEETEILGEIPNAENIGQNSISKEASIEINNELEDLMEVSATIQNDKSTEPTYEDFETKVPDELTEAYNNLLLLVHTPTKRKILEEDVQCLPQFKSNFEYQSIECKILCRPIFSFQNKNKIFENNINLDRCILFGILESSNMNPRVLSDDEKHAVLTIENFENLDLLARLSVLSMQVKEMEKQIESNTTEDNCTVDQFGRSPVETLNIYQKLVLALQRRIQEVNSVTRWNL